MPDRILLANGLIADGSALPLRRADVLLEEGLIRQIGPQLRVSDATRINCENLLVAPGFIDAHSHSDLQVLTEKREKILQGVTSEVVGNCGFSPYPNSRPSDLHDFANGILFGEGDWGWPSASEYLLETHAKARLASVSSLIGHGSLRIALAGPRQGPLEESTIEAMERVLDEALAEGATGFSTGLMYAPGSSAPTEELERLCRVVARRGKIYCSHIRDYSTNLLQAIDEQISLASVSGCRLQISHLQAVGRANWQLNSLALQKLESARQSGVDVMFDCYPYVAGSTVLTQLLPQWALEGGTQTLLARLSDAQTRSEIARQIHLSMVHEWSDIFISAVGSAANSDAVGQSIDELSTRRSQSPFDVVANLLTDERGAVNMLTFNQSEENLRTNLSHPMAIIISDGFYVKGRPHPRLHGTFPELLGNICRDKGWLPLTDAIHKVTGAPAERFSIKQRGFLREGYFADVAIFDQALLRSNSTYSQPELPPEGIVAVIRQGSLCFLNEPARMI